MSDIVERLSGPHEWGYRDPAEGMFIRDDTPFDAAVEIERLRAEHEITAADLHAWMKLKAAAEARLAEAVEWVREARKFCQDGLAGDGCTPEQALERIHEASVDFLAKLEGR